MDKLSGEDRARLEGLLDYLQRTEDHPQAKADVDVFARALALIDQQEKALEALEAEAAQEQQNAVEAEAKVDRLEKTLEAADKLLFEVDGTCLCFGPGHICGICEARNEYKTLRGNND